jgi:putative redox protein
MQEPKIIAIAEAENNGEVYTTHSRMRQHSMLVDESIQYGGQDLGPMPGDLLCLSLASCKVITLRMYAQRKGWPVKQIKVTVQLVKASQQESGSQHTFVCELSLTGELDEAQRARMLEISKACPIQRLLAKPSEVVTTLA